MPEIGSTKAYNNTLFRLAGVRAGEADLARIVREWYPVTQAFCLGLMAYNSVLAAFLLRSRGAQREALEEAILVPIAIGAEEFGLGRSGAAGIHYRMFARLGEPLGISLDDLRMHSLGSLKATRRLAEGITESLNDPFLGAGCLRVVEATAYKIVEAMDYLFRAKKRPDGELLFSEYQLEYITLHLEIEKEHDALTTHFLESLCANEGERRTVEIGMTTICDLFGDFWEALAAYVFPAAAEMHRAECYHSF